MKQRIDGIVRSLHPHRKNTGLVVGVIQRDHCSIFGYGNVSDAGPEPPCGDTLFEIGSITKVFTATLLSTTVVDGLLNLDDSVRDLVPALSNLPPEITPGPACHPHIWIAENAIECHLVNAPKSAQSVCSIYDG